MLGVENMALQNIYNYSKPKVYGGQVKNTASQRPVNVVKNNQYKNQGDKYLEQKIFAAKPEELTLMLYEGIIKFINQAKIYLDQNNIEKTNYAIQRAQAIVDELSGTLDLEFEHSGDLINLYTFIKDNLIDANIQKEMKPLDDALEIAKEMLGMWKELMATGRE